MYQLSIPSVIHRWCYQMLDKCQCGRSKTRHVLKQNEQFGYPQYNIVASAQSPHYTKLATTSHTIMQIRHISTDRCPESVASLVWVTPGADFNGVTPSQLALVEHPPPSASAVFFQGGGTLGLNCPMFCHQAYTLLYIHGGVGVWLKNNFIQPLCHFFQHACTLVIDSVIITGTHYKFMASHLYNSFTEYNSAL